MRFIPAGAGNTSGSILPNTDRTVYPRWRGEHGSNFTNVPKNFGLSPLARGTHIIASPEPVVLRFIPAGAGNTSECPKKVTLRAVYPRWRGEHGSPGRSSQILTGLSPLARGTHRYRSLISASWRFIPAGAGNTRVEKEAQLREAVYPRWRGEHRTAVPLRDIELGLSPLARGTLRAGLIEAPDVRFIPAGAGNTGVIWMFRVAICGLSPLARGTLTPSIKLSIPERFIPAGAGNTEHNMPMIASFAVYPRWRGEHVLSTSFRFFSIGLSPLARGTQRA